VQTPNVGVSASTFTENNTSRDSGIYTFFTRVFTPTQNVYSKGDGNFTLDSLVLDILGMSPVNLVTSKVFQFQPIYTTSINGELVTNGFIE